LDLGSEFSDLLFEVDCLEFGEVAAFRGFPAVVDTVEELFVALDQGGLTGPFRVGVATAVGLDAPLPAEFQGIVYVHSDVVH